MSGQKEKYKKEITKAIKQLSESKRLLEKYGFGSAFSKLESAKITLQQSEETLGWIEKEWELRQK